MTSLDANPVLTAELAGFYQEKFQVCEGIYDTELFGTGSNDFQFWDFDTGGDGCGSGDFLANAPMTRKIFQPESILSRHIFLAKDCNSRYWRSR